MKLLRWNNWFYAGSAAFLQSSVQEISLQTTLGGGIGRYLKNTNRASIYVLGGLGWQNVGYTQNTPDQGTQNTAVAFVSTEIKAFKFKKTNLDISASLLPAISDAWTYPLQYERGLLPKDIWRSLVELFFLWKLG